jgi:aerobic C4-dicarboxylate transport protein
MIIAPVIFLTVATGIAGMSDMKAVGSVAGKAFAYFLFFSTLALIIGLIVANVVRPGEGLNIDPATLDAGAVATYTKSAEAHTISAFLLNIIPETLFSAMTEGQILQVLLIAILAGVALAMTRPASDLVLDVLASFNAVVFRLVHMLMKLAPIGAFGAIAFTIGEFGIGSLANLAALIAIFYLTSL